jgi:hypothetical protein
MRTLHGRADFASAICLQQRLSIDPAPLEGNPNHANVCGWPADKPAQKMIALEIAAAARFVAAVS